MEETRTAKRIVNLTPEEVEELEEKEEELLPQLKDLSDAYNGFDQKKVRQVKLETLHDNVVYKINFSYGELYKAVNNVREIYNELRENGIPVSDELNKKVEKLFSENAEKRTYS